MVAWTVLILPEAREDLAALARARAGMDVSLRDAILETFEDPFKSRRMEQAIEGSARTMQIARLESSHDPLSFRLQIHHDYRATMAFLPSESLAIVTHVFVESADPAHWRAAPVHEARLAPWLLSFNDYARRAGL